MSEAGSSESKWLSSKSSRNSEANKCTKQHDDKIVNQVKEKAKKEKNEKARKSAERKDPDQTRLSGSLKRLGHIREKPRNESTGLSQEERAKLHKQKWQPMEAVGFLQMTPEQYEVQSRLSQEFAGELYRRALQ